MLTLATLLMASAMVLQADVTVVLGHAERDLTGDGKPEILRVVGIGPTIDDLGVTFTIESAGRTIYRYDMGRMTRTVGFEAWFFGKEKFQRPQEFIEYLRASAPGKVADIPRVIDDDQQASATVPGSVIWDEIQNAPITIFTFSPGGDRIEAIGWSARAGRFYRLLDCC